jgi:hypothetical protein
MKKQSPCSLGLSATSISHNKPATSNQPAVLFSHNKPAPAISHQPTEQAECWEKETLNPLEMQMAEGSALTKTNATRQSRRVKDQGLGAMKIADKAAPMAQKKNLEGNRLTFKNSFAVSNNELMHRSKKMGVKINDEELQKFDLLKDLEVARANLNEQTNKLEVTPILEDDNNLPLEEIKFIEWQSDSFDEE